MESRTLCALVVFVGQCVFVLIWVALFVLQGAIFGGLNFCTIVTFEGGFVTFCGLRLVGWLIKT